MKYRYINAGFKEAWRAVKAFEKGEVLYIKERADPKRSFKEHLEEVFKIINISQAARDFKLIHTKEKIQLTFDEKEQERGYIKEFTLDTPWMVKNNDDEEWEFVFALSYSPEDTDGHLFNAFDNQEDSMTASSIYSYKYARHLTKEEEIEYLGEKK